MNNYDKTSKYNTLPSISYDTWMDMFHETIIIYSLYNELLTAISQHYSQIAAMNNNLFQIRINREDPIISTEYHEIVYDPMCGIWRYVQG